MSGKWKSDAASVTLRSALVILGFVWLLSYTPDRVGQAVEITGLNAEDGDKVDDKRFAGGASLKTEPDLESRLERARLFAEEGTYNHASTLWQNVLNQSGDTLITRDGRTFVSLAEDVERTIAKLPVAGLRIYRITADGEAQAILADGVGDKEEQALSAVVRRYFVSSLGDDAAYKLGCIALDNYDFVGASRLFLKILEDHPDPSVPLADVWLRLAVATAHLGDIKSAQDAMAEAEKATGEKPDQEVFELVRKDIEQAGQSSGTIALTSQDWPMSMGNPARTGQMQKLSDGVTSATLTKMWAFSFPLDFTVNSTPQNQIYRSGRGIQQPVNIPTDEKSLVSKWKSMGWRPTGQLLTADGRAYYKTGSDLTCWDMTGESTKPIWRTAWANLFEVDSMTVMMNQMSRNMGVATGMQNQPQTDVEVMLFGDRIQQSMSISQGVIFSVEGQQYAKQMSQRPTPSSQRVQFNYTVVPRRTRKNWLAAYDVRTGKALWHRSAAEVKEGSDETAGGDVGFMAAPVPYGNLLLAPVSDGGTIWLNAMARKDGKTVWRSYLCDEPSGGCKPWSPVGVSVDGRDVYVLCGAGVIFAVDATTGTIRYAVRYERSETKNTQLQRMGYGIAALSVLNGWDDDVVVPYRNVLVVMASDSDKLFAVDRRTGDFLWDSPRTPLDHTADYCVGVSHDGGFIVAGKNCVRRYDIVTGRLRWETIVQDSFGRAMVTEDAVYVPVKNTIVRLDVESGKEVSQATVSLTSDEPVGNLYSDGEKIWVVGANKLYALTNLQQRLAVLDSRIKKGDPSAHIERMKLLAKDNKLDAAVADLLNAYKIVRKEDGSDPAASLLFEGMIAIQLEELKPDVVLGVMSECFVKDETAASLSKELAGQRADLVFSALRSIRQQKTSGAAAAILDVVPLISEQYQLAMARQALVTTATEEDLEQLREAVESGKPELQRISVDAFALLAKDKAKPSLDKLLESGDESIQLAAARALANSGDRAALSPLVKLLSSKETTIRARSAAALRHLTGQQFDYAAYEDEPKREAALKNWTDWLAKNGDTVELNIPIPDHEPMLGRTLISYYSRNLVVELDEHGKVRWQKNVPNPWACQGLPNGHRLVAAYARQEIIEFDAAGNEVWKKTGLPGNPFSVRRLADGNTLVACSNSQQVVEYKRDGSIAWKATVSNRPVDAHRLENGNTLVALAGSHQVVEVDRDGKVVWSVNNMTNAFSVQRLENGNTLVALTNGGLVEVDRDGKKVWTKTGLTQCYDAQRLPNGNTVIADNVRVQEIDSSGKQIWERVEQGASGVSRF